MSLSNADKNTIGAANAAAIATALEGMASPGELGLGNSFPGNRISAAEPFSADEVASIKELMAIGVPNHCIDGWSFLARSVAALISGDSHAARHFAYYAELRAALCLLNAGGIGIFNRSNFVALSNGDLARLNSDGTHVAAWEAFYAWVARPEAARLIANSITIAEAPLGECLNALFPQAGGAAAYSLSSLVLDWGLDLQQASTDKHTREISSYDPHCLLALPVSAEDTFNFVVMLWRAFEPNGLDRFDAIDIHILRSALQHYFSEGRVISLEDHQRLPERVGSLASYDFLTAGGGEAEHPLITTARDNANPAGPFAMIARATLLLRTATAVSRSALSSAGLLDSHLVRPWLGRYASDRAISAAELPETTGDLWADIADAIDRIVEMQADAHARAQSISRWSVANDASSTVPRLSELERVALWGLTG